MIISWIEAEQRSKLTQIIANYVNILSAKFDFEKMKQNKVRGFSQENLGEVSEMGIFFSLLEDEKLLSSN